MMQKTVADIEPWIVALDDLAGGFEIVYWCTDHQEALDFYAEQQTRDYTDVPTYPDKEGRNIHIFQMIATSDEVLSPGIPDSLPESFSSNSQQLRINPDPVKTADESQGTKSGITASPSQKEAEKEKKQNV